MFEEISDVNSEILEDNFNRAIELAVAEVEAKQSPELVIAKLQGKVEAYENAIMRTK